MILTASEELDRRTTLLNQANHFTIRRNYEKANSIYKKLLQENPDDYIVAEKLIQNYFKTSQIEAAEELIEKYSKKFPELTLLRLNTVLLINLGKTEEAYSEIENYFNTTPKNLNRYREFSLLFQTNKQYKYAIKLLLEAREIAQDEFLNARLLANNYQYLGEYEKAITEYIRYLRKNKSYRFYVYNRIKDMLKQDPVLVEVLQTEYERWDNQQVSELYAKSLTYVGKYEMALQIYSKLDAKLLRDFAESQYKLGNYTIAKKALQQYIQREVSAIAIAEAQLTLADIYITNNEFEAAQEILWQVYQNKELQNRRNFYRSHANMNCRVKLAELAMKQGKDAEIIVQYYQEARKFAMNSSEKQLLDLKIIDYLTMQGDFEAASQKLQKIKGNTEIGTQVDKLADYYTFLLAFIQQKESADSLLTEVMINIPQNKQINNILLLKEIVKDMSVESKSKVLTAFRKKNIYQYSSAMTILDSLSTNIQEQGQVKILQGMWALENNDPQAQKYFEFDFQKPILKEIAAYFEAMLEKDGQIKSLMASEFLKNNPNAVFAPQFREFVQ